MFSYPCYLSSYTSELAMIAEVDVFISNYTLVDPEVYQLWVDGYSSSEAVAVLQQETGFKQPGTTVELIVSDVLNHYRTYSLLERLLHNPPKLAEQLAFQIEPQTKQLLIEKYYQFDDSVIRELLGKKLSSRHRKDLDEVSEKTNVSLKSCRRQFDNVKRVFKTVEEIQGSVVQNIRNLFLLPDELAKRYGAVVFIACMRFETSKRKLQRMSFADFYHCSLAIMASWTYVESNADYDDTDLDREFLLELREFRILFDKEKELKHLVCHRLKPKLLERAYQELESNFRMYSRAIIGLACNLHRTRELRDGMSPTRYKLREILLFTCLIVIRCLFLELVERCIEPWRQVSWTETDLSNFLASYTACALEMDVFREHTVKSAWERYMSVINTCLMRIFKSY